MALPLVYHPEYVTPLPPGHRFPMPKFGLVYEMLLAEGIVSTSTVHVPDSADRELLTLVHTEEYVDSILEGTIKPAALRRIGLPWSEGLARRTRRAVGGTLLTARLALEHGLACNTAGGTHHAHPSFGSGFCLFNDLAVAAAALLAEEAVRRILVVDLDVHQGDGTAAAFQADDRVFTFSMHCGSNFPFRKTPGDLDVALPEGLSDDEYLRELESILPDLVNPAVPEMAPDLVLYDAGVDVFAGDRLGRLNLTLEGITRRDRFVLETCLAADVPVAAVIGGGYDQDVSALADRHCILHRVAASLRPGRSRLRGLAQERPVP
ncbi:MAG: histone deacetylase [Spirochaetaceae bacterium]|nr:MAG: histone deacetylase [Spirochaetaceae bacterium]